MVRQPIQVMAAILLMLLSTTLWAATITVKTDRDTVAVNERFRIIFKAEGSLDGEPDFSPLNQDFQLLGTGQSSSFSMVNGRTSSSKTFTLTVTALRQGTITIPSISFGRDKSPESSITVVAAASRPAPATPSAPPASRELMFVTSEVDTATPYVQQQVILRVKVYRDRRWARASLSDPRLDGVEARVQPLGQARTYNSRVGNKNYQVTEMAYAIFPQQSGELSIAPFQVTARFPSGVKKQRLPLGGFGNDPFDDPIFDGFFSRQSYETRSAQSKPLQVEVKPIPAAFTGKHWLPARDIQLQQTWSSDIKQLEVGEPVTRTLAIIGDGVSIGQLPEPGMPDSSRIKSYPDQPLTDERITSDGLLSTLTRKLALIPSQPGQHEIPALEIPWWNTETDQMQIARLPAVTLQATGTAIIPATPEPPAAPAEPEQAPQDSMPAMTNQPAGTPVDDGDLSTQTLLLIAVVVLLILWIITLLALLARRREKSTPTSPSPDTNHKAELKSALRQLESACRQQQPAEIRDALIQWARVFWPQEPPGNLDEIAKRLPGEASEQVMRLSAELYGRESMSWDAEQICQAIKQLRNSTGNTHKRKKQGLEPLYR